jgi:hypothetical protein
VASTPKPHAAAANSIKLPLHKTKECDRKLAKVAVLRVHHHANNVFNELFTINTGKLEQKAVVLSIIENHKRIPVESTVSTVVLNFKVIVFNDRIIPVVANAAADGRPQTEPRFT